MGVMEKMRNSTASILWILIFSFGLLWVLADTQVFDAITAGPQSLGVVNGESISFDEYNNRVSYYTEQFNEREMGPMSAEVRAFYENQAWEDLVAARLIQDKMNDLGIKVTDEELRGMILGDNPAPFIRQQFQQDDGTIDRVALRAAIDSPENTEIWIMIEQQLRDERRQQKMNNFISAGMRVSNLEIRDEYIRENSFADVQFVRFPYSEVQDDEITFSDNDLRTYYRNNPEQFKREKSFQFRYVSWDTTPTAEDTTRTIDDVERLRERFAEAEDDSSFVRRNQSQTTFRGGFVPESEVRDEYRAVLDLNEGEVSDVIMINGDPYLLKKIEQRGSEVRFATFSYKVEADVVGTIDRLAEQAREFEFFASEEGFESEAERREMEIQRANATKGSNVIPGLGRSQQVLQSLDNLRRNQISDPIELEGEIIVIQLLNTTPEGTRPFEDVRGQIENIVRNNKRKEIVRDRVQGLFAENQSLEALASATGKEVQVAENVRMGSNNIPGAGREPKVIGSIFGLNAGEIHGPVEGQNAVFVVQADDVAIADANQMSSAERQRIRQRLEQQKFSAFNEIFIDELKTEADIRDYRSQVLR